MAQKNLPAILILSTVVISGIGISLLQSAKNPSRLNVSSVSSSVTSFSFDTLANSTASTISTVSSVSSNSSAIYIYESLEASSSSNALANSTASTISTVSSVSSNSSSVASSVSTVSSSSSNSSINYTYKDGQYTSSISYTVPGNNTGEINVQLTLANDIITQVSISQTSHGSYSDQYQSSFASSYQSYVVGKNIDTISMSRIGSASLTTGGFQQALSVIRNDAKS